MDSVIFRRIGRLCCNKVFIMNHYSDDVAENSKHQTKVNELEHGIAEPDQGRQIIHQTVRVNKSESPERSFDLVLFWVFTEMAQEPRNTEDLKAVLMESEGDRAMDPPLQLTGDAMYLNYRQLNSLPSRLFEADMSGALCRLYLKHNLLQCLPPEIKVLQHLTELYLHSNGLRTLPEEVGELTRLKMLSLSNNQLRSLPACICRLRNLQRLQLSRNQLTQLPSDIGDLRQLRSLEVSHNRLRNLPHQLSHCSNLRQLCLDSNQLVSLPRQLCRLVQLSEISACDNHLVSLPQDLGCMQSLQTVYVDRNPFLCAMPASMLRKTVGFCGLDTHSVPEELLNRQKHIIVKSGQEMEVIVSMPQEIRSIGHYCTDCIPMLLELTLRNVYKALQSSASSLQEGEMPAELLSLLQSPTAHCQNCDAEIFISAFPIVFREQDQPYILGLCCSSTCVRQCILKVHLPLLYPSMEDLSLALVVA